MPNVRARLIQVIGWGILAVYFSQTPLRFAAIWVIAYVAITVIVGFAFVFAVKPLIRAFSAQLKQRPPLDQEKGGQALFPHPKNAPLENEFRRRPLYVLLAPGETGVFFVPVAIVGVTWWSALIAASLFGLAHYKTYSSEQCAVKAVAAFLNCYLVLPHGLIHLVLGHLLIDVIAVGAFTLLARRQLTEAPPSQADVNKTTAP